MIEILITTISIFALLVLGFLAGKLFEKHHWKDKLPDIREEAIAKSRAVLSGQFSEQLAPYLPDFPFSPTEARFIGKPIDFIIFKGMDEKNISEIIFVEVKSGKSRMNKHEQNLSNAIKNKNVSWQEYRIPEEITANKTITK